MKVAYVAVGVLFAFSDFSKAQPTDEATCRATAGVIADKYAERSASADIVSKACQAARSALGKDQVDTSPEAEEPWSETCYANPYCTILPRSSNDVLVAIQIIKKYQVKFAVRSGGHSPNPGWSSIGSQGILIALERLNSTKLSSDSTFASIGPGARWGEAYEALGAEKALVVGARIPDVGVGGLLLGGGYSYFSEQFGLVADNVKNFEVVLSSGKIVNANAECNEDLFWALKGGGPNFGIVTRYDLYTVPVWEIWGELSVYSTDQAFDVLAAFDRWQENGSSDVKSSVVLSITLDSILVGLLYSEPLTERPSAFDAFSSLTPLVIPVPAMNMPFTAIIQIVGATSPSTPGRHDYRGVSSQINTELTQEVYTFWREKALAVHEATGANQTFAIQHVGPNLIKQGVQNGGNPLGIPPTNQQWWTTTIDWEDAKDDDLVRSVSIETTALWAELGKQRGLNNSFIYMNDASRDQSPLSSYGSDSVQKLKKISLKYDPERVFQKLQNDGFLISKV
ncbi:hypothetical protein B0O99DRAFT_633847 [Bisporella sp. PMI_857]|nr:hypothetical protein B0O99DRAFT_633847 [Bisporella sp. PMI_857]